MDFPNTPEAGTSRPLENGQFKPAIGLPSVCHVSCDFPDPVEPAKTPVIQSLLDLTRSSFSHRVVSMNRRNPGFGTLARGQHSETDARFEWGHAWVYHAPPWGIAHDFHLRKVGERLAASLASQPPSLLFGHKLTIEGIAVAHAAQLLQRPYGISIQGNTDCRILSARPDLARKFARIFHEAAVVFAFAPWALTKIERTLGKRRGPLHLLPCPTELDTRLAPSQKGDALLSAFHLQHYKNKNLPAVASALGLIRRAGCPTPFALIGGGHAKAEAACDQLLRPIAHAKREGALERAALATRFNRGIGLVMPSHRETFGLVFIEALFCGLPIIYPADRAVAGYFDNAPFAIAVEPKNNHALADAIMRLVRQEGALKASLHDWQRSAHSAQFTRQAIADTFAKGLREALAGGRA